MLEYDNMKEEKKAVPVKKGGKPGIDLQNIEIDRSGIEPAEMSFSGDPFGRRFEGGFYGRIHRSQYL